MEIQHLVVLLVWIGFGITSGVMASIKGRSFLIWMFLTLLLSPVWLFILLVLSSIKKCPFCASTIPQQARVCARCSREQPA